LYSTRLCQLIHHLLYVHSLILSSFFFFTAPPTTELYTLSLHDALPISTPFVTWSRITLCGPSATRESISTPRFMGPGCMMVMGRPAFSSRSAVTPKTR